MALGRWTGLVQDGVGNAVAGALIEVRLEDNGALVPLFSDREGAVALANPFAAAEATIFFHAAGGSYRVTALKGGLQQIWRYVPVGTASELDIETLEQRIDDGLDNAVLTSPQDLLPDAQEQARLNIGAANFDEVAVALAPIALAIADIQGSRFAMRGGIADAFDDESGVNATASTNEVYEATNDLYRPIETPPVGTFLTHFDGPNGSSTFSDSIGGKTITPFNGGGSVSTAQAKFGSASFGPGAASRGVFIAAHADFQPGAGDFTLDFWWYPTAGAAFQTIWSMGYTGAGALLVQTDQSATPRMMVYIGGTAVATEGSGASLNAWHHYVVQRQGTTLRIMRDGVQTATATAPGAINSASIVTIGNEFNGNLPASGYLDEIRWTKGAALFTAPYSVPTAAYSGLPSNMTLISVAYAAQVQPSKARLVLQLDTSLTVVPGIDFAGKVSRDGGTTWFTAALSLASALGTIKTYEDSNIDLSASPMGTTMLWRAETLTNKSIAMTGVVEQWD